MIRLMFTDEQVEQLRQERFCYPHPRVQRKMDALLLKSQGMAHQDICRIVGITENTLRAWLREFAEGGVEGLKRFQKREPYGALRAYQDHLAVEFRERPPISVAEARGRIAQITGVERGRTQVRVFLRSLGMKYRQVGVVPAKLDVEAQEAFKKTTWSRV